MRATASPESEKKKLSQRQTPGVLPFPTGLGKRGVIDVVHAVVSLSIIAILLSERLGLILRSCFTHHERCRGLVCTPTTVLDNHPPVPWHQHPRQLEEVAVEKSSIMSDRFLAGGLASPCAISRS